MGDRVWVPDIKKRGVIRARAHTPRSYIVETPAGELPRNRRDLKLIPEENNPEENNPV